MKKTKILPTSYTEMKFMRQHSSRRAEIDRSSIGKFGQPCRNGIKQLGEFNPCPGLSEKNHGQCRNCRSGAANRRKLVTRIHGPKPLSRGHILQLEPLLWRLKTRPEQFTQFWITKKDLQKEIEYVQGLIDVYKPRIDMYHAEIKAAYEEQKRAFETQIRNELRRQTRS